jgi:hypothetical protein
MSVRSSKLVVIWVFGVVPVLVSDESLLQETTGSAQAAPTSRSATGRSSETFMIIPLT